MICYGLVRYLWHGAVVCSYTCNGKAGCGYDTGVTSDDTISFRALSYGTVCGRRDGLVWNLSVEVVWEI